MDALTVNSPKSLSKGVRALAIACVIAIVSLFTTFFGGSIDAFAVQSTGADAMAVSANSDGTVTITNKAFNDRSSKENPWVNVITKYRTFIVGISGIGAVTMVLCFIVCFIKLGASTGNPQARQSAITGILWTGIAAAGLGSVAIITGFFANMFTNKK